MKRSRTIANMNLLPGSEDPQQAPTADAETLENLTNAFNESHLTPTSPPSKSPRTTSSTTVQSPGREESKRP